MTGDVFTAGCGRELVQRLYHEHGEALWRYVNRILRDPHQAEDVVQETMLRAWKHAERLSRGTGTEWGWLSTVARNLAIDRIRTRKACPLEMVEDPSLLPRARHTDDHAGRVVNSMALADALDSLGTEYRTTLREIYFSGLTRREAAHALAVPVGTVKSRLHRGLRLLREHVEREDMRLSA